MLDNIIESIDEYKNDDNSKFIISRIISRYIGYEDIEFNDDQLVVLLDFIDWHFPTIMQHSDDWTCSFEQCGWDFSKILRFANKMNRKITGVNEHETILSICIAIIYGDDAVVEKYVIDNNIKISKTLFDEDDPIIFDMEIWSNDIGYNFFE